MSRSGVVQGPIEAPQMASGDLNYSSLNSAAHTRLSFYANCAREAVNKCAQINVHHSPLHSKSSLLRILLWVLEAALALFTKRNRSRELEFF
jgi:hypothetical protein